MKITLDIPDSEIEATLQNAAECSVGYWAQDLYTAPAKAAWYAVERDKDASDIDSHVELDIERGLRMMIQSGQWAAVAINRWNARNIDRFVQYAAFGELRYV